MHPLSEPARVILHHMAPGRPYGTGELRAFAPDAGIERFREIMHELWVRREVERVGHAGWRRRSVPPADGGQVAVETGTVAPEDLFDHDTFAGFFK